MENQKDELFIDTASSGRQSSTQTFSPEKIIKNCDQAYRHPNPNHLIGPLLSPRVHRSSWSCS